MIGSCVSELPPSEVELEAFFVILGAMVTLTHPILKPLVSFSHKSSQPQKQVIYSLKDRPNDITLFKNQFFAALSTRYVVTMRGTVLDVLGIVHTHR